VKSVAKLFVSYGVNDRVDTRTDVLKPFDDFKGVAIATTSAVICHYVEHEEGTPAEHKSTNDYGKSPCQPNLNQHGAGPLSAVPHDAVYLTIRKENNK
jgi:hypothetical protein